MNYYNTIKTQNVHNINKCSKLLPLHLIPLHNTAGRVGISDDVSTKFLFHYLGFPNGMVTSVIFSKPVGSIHLTAYLDNRRWYLRANLAIWVPNRTCAFDILILFIFGPLLGSF